MKTHCSVLLRNALIVLVVYALSLSWGYIRVPWAAIKSLADYQFIVKAPVVSLPESDVNVSRPQRWYLDLALAQSPTPVVPRVHVSVQWNALLCARVRSGLHAGPLAAEDKDSLYVCLFGAWIPIYTFDHVMA